MCALALAGCGSGGETGAATQVEPTAAVEDAAVDEAAVDVADADAVWEAEALAFTAAPTTMPADGADIALVSVGGLPHNVVLEGFADDEPVVDAPGDGVYTATVDVPAGEYTYYCSIVGHRAAGMEGTITVG